MKKWIRWQGLLIFVLVLLFGGLLFYFFIDSIIEREIEKHGTRIVGARVDLDSADLSLSPAGLTLNRLRITNPDEPMSNAVEINRIAFFVDTLNLLRRKVIVDVMAVEEVQFNTPRKTSGAISGRVVKKEESEQKKAFQMPSLEMPDVREIMKKEKLESIEEIKRLQNDISTMKEKWKTRLARLPDKETFDQYRKKIESIKGVKGKGIGDLKGTVGSVKEIATIKDEISNSIKLIKNADKEFKDEMNSIRTRMKRIKAAPRKDIDRIMDKYSLSPKGLSNMSQMLFGEKIAGYINTAIAWQEKLQPILQGNGAKKQSEEADKPIRGKGINVKFSEDEPLPEMLIRVANVSLKLDAGDLAGKINNITDDQATLGKPLDFSFSGEKLKDLNSVKVYGSMNHIQPGPGIDRVNADIKGFGFNNVKISESGSLPITLEKGSADIDLKAVMNGSNITSGIVAGLMDLKISAVKEGDTGTVAQTLSSALEDVSRMAVKADIDGTLDDYNIKISSDLDKILKNALGSQVKKQTAALKGKLTNEIMSKVKGPMGNAEGSLGGLDVFNKDIKSRLNLGNNVLKDSGKASTGGFKLPSF